MGTWIFDERPQSGDFEFDPFGSDSYTLRFVAGRHDDEGYVKAYAIAATPLIFKGLWRQSISAKAIGGGLWHLDVPYGEKQPPAIGEYRISYDTTGGTAHITQAKEHIADWGRLADVPPNHGGAINVKEDGRPEGTDIVVPSFRWTEEHTFLVAIAGWGYAYTLSLLTGMVNNSPFRSFPAGQVLFEGATGNYSSAAEDAHEIQITFNFAHNANVINATFDEVQNVDKYGWQYLWFEHEEEADDDAKRLISPLLAAHAERTYDAADFGLLLLPGA